MQLFFTIWDCATLFLKRFEIVQGFLKIWDCEKFFKDCSTKFFKDLRLCNFLPVPRPLLVLLLCLGADSNIRGNIRGKLEENKCLSLVIIRGISLTYYRAHTWPGHRHSRSLPGPFPCSRGTSQTCTPGWKGILLFRGNLCDCPRLWK